MVLKSAEVLRNAGRIVDATKTLINSSRTRDRVQRAMVYLKSGLWERQSFGMDYLTTDPEVVSELLELAKDLEGDMNEDEAREVRCTILIHSGANLEKHRSQCSERGTKAISKPFISCIPSSFKREITPRLCCASIQPLSPLSPHMGLLQWISDPNFPFIFLTLSF